MIAELEWIGYPLFWAGVMGIFYLVLDRLEVSIVDYQTDQTHQGDQLKVKNRGFKLSLANQGMSMVHACFMILVSSYGLLTEPHWNVINTPLQTWMAKVSVGYFVTDQLRIIIYDHDSMIFTFHHLLAAGYLASTLYLGKGGFLSIISAFMAEITNPLQIIWATARQNQLTRVYNWSTPIYTWTFLVVRCGIIPVVTVYVYHYLLTERPVADHWLYWWMFSSGCLNVAGWFWSCLIWRGYQKFKLRNAAVK